FQGPPHGAKPLSDTALEYATLYGMFHWGPIAWSIYVFPALPIAYLVFVKKQPVFRISEAFRPILKGQTDKFLGKLVDILFIFGL
ncbi:BCCT family transporter, partial [Staphylococcus felis]